MEKNRLILSSLVLGLCIIAATYIVSEAFVQVRKLNDVLTVSGSAKEKVTSDSVKWNAMFTRNSLASDLKNGYVIMKNDEAKINKFFLANGLKKEDIEISPVAMNEVYKQDPNAPKEYALLQTVTVSSSDVNKISNLAKNTQPLIDQGIIFSSQSVEYFTSKLPELRVSLLSNAINDAKNRASKIAESSDKKVGAIQSASMGVVQVMPVNSIEVSDYGAYDTSTIEKEVMVTVKTVFRLE